LAFPDRAQASIDALTKAAGFQYEYDSKTSQFAHATAIMVLTPEGRIGQYYYGVEYAPKDLRLGLIEASKNRIGTVVDQVLLYCYHYDPNTGKYGPIISRILQLEGGATVLILGIVLVVMFRLGSTQGYVGAKRIS
jgi:protein SCO1